MQTNETKAYYKIRLVILHLCFDQIVINAYRLQEYALL